MGMNSFAEIIDALGIAATASILAVSESHVRTLKARDSIPAPYFAKLVSSEQGKACGVTFEMLHDLLDRVARRRSSPLPAVHSSVQ